MWDIAPGERWLTWTQIDFYDAASGQLRSTFVAEIFQGSAAFTPDRTLLAVSDEAGQMAFYGVLADDD